MRLNLFGGTVLLGRGSEGSALLPVFEVQPRRKLFYNAFPKMRNLAISMLLVVVAFFVAPAAARPLIRAYYAVRQDESGLEVLQLVFGLKMAETVLAFLSIALVTVVYGLLIRRGSLMSTTAIYPKGPIEANIGKLLSIGWLDRSGDAIGTTITESLSEKGKVKTQTSIVSTTESPNHAIRLFYLGKMITDDQSDRVAKGLLECAAKPIGEIRRSPLWLTSGSPLTKSIVQLLIWEWTSFWLIILMMAATLMFNGFFTDQLNIDSYPRLTVMLIYAASYFAHSVYVWNVCSSFFTNVASGAAWSLLERAKFAVGDTRRLGRRKAGQIFEFKSIDKASKEFVPTTFQACFKDEVRIDELEEDRNTLSNHDEQEEDPKDVSAALATLGRAQENERNAATYAVDKALERIISNAMVMMGVTISTGFSAWIAQQDTSDTPNNFSTQQIGSLALLASLSLGVATMFTSAMYLSIMDSAYRTILSLKETKINGHAVEHYKKRRSSQSPLSFTRGTVPVAKVGFNDILFANRWRKFLGVVFLGPAFALLPDKDDHERTSGDIEFDFEVLVRKRQVLLTTRGTEVHAKNRNGVNIEAINVCYIEGKDKRH